MEFIYRIAIFIYIMRVAEGRVGVGHARSLAYLLAELLETALGMRLKSSRNADQGKLCCLFAQRFFSLSDTISIAFFRAS